MNSTVNPNFIVEGFNSFISGSGVLGILFNVIVFIVVLLYVITGIRTYSKSMFGEHVKVSEFIRPGVVLLFIIFWKWIYFDILVSGFDALMGLMINRLDEDATRNAELYAKIKDNAMSDSVSFLDLSIEAFISWVLKSMVIIVNTIFDVAIALYVGVNDLILGIVAPIALAFMMLEETKDIFIKWLKTFIVFRIYMLLVVLINVLGMRLLSAISAAAMSSVVGLQVGVGGAAAEAGLAAISGVAMLGYIVFKIIFALSSFKILTTLFGVGEGGVGAGASGLTGSLMKGAKMAMTKGAVK